jgi:hypothetical protein
MRDLLETYQHAIRRYGEDVAHQGVLLTLVRRKTQSSAYLKRLCRALAAGGYHDAVSNPPSDSVWHRERLMGHEVVVGRMLWASAMLCPERQALARELLRQMPQEIIDAAIDQPFHWNGQSRCGHAPGAWYLYQHGGHRMIRCRRCLAARKHHYISEARGA